MGLSELYPMASPSSKGRVDIYSDGISGRKSDVGVFGRPVEQAIVLPFARRVRRGWSVSSARGEGAADKGRGVDADQVLAGGMVNVHIRNRVMQHRRSPGRCQPAA